MTVTTSSSLPKRVFIGRLPDGATSLNLRTLFSPFGRVDDAEVRGAFGFVSLATEDEARAAIAALDGTELRGRRLQVESARPKGSSTGRRGGDCDGRDTSVKLYVNRVASLSEEDLRRIFEEFGRVVTCEKHHRNQHVCFVRLETYFAASKATTKLHRTKLPGSDQISVVELANDNKVFGIPLSAFVRRGEIVKLFVGNLVEGCAADVLARLFERFGPVDEVILISGKSFGFVKMLSQEHAEAAVAGLDRHEFLGKPLKVAFSVKNGPRGSSQWHAGALDESENVFDVRSIGERHGYSRPLGFSASMTSGGRSMGSRSVMPRLSGFRRDSESDFFRGVGWRSDFGRSGAGLGADLGRTGAFWRDGLLDRRPRPEVNRRSRLDSLQEVFGPRGIPYRTRRDPGSPSPTGRVRRSPTGRVRRSRSRSPIAGETSGRRRIWTENLHYGREEEHRATRPTVRFEDESTDEVRDRVAATTVRFRDEPMEQAVRFHDDLSRVGMRFDDIGNSGALSFEGGFRKDSYGVSFATPTKTTTESDRDDPRSSFNPSSYNNDYNSIASAKYSSIMSMPPRMKY